MCVVKEGEGAKEGEVGVDGAGSGKRETARQDALSRASERSESLHDAGSGHRTRHAPLTSAQLIERPPDLMRAAPRRPPRLSSPPPSRTTSSPPAVPRDGIAAHVVF